MKRTVINIEYEKGSPPDIEIYGRQLTSVTERAIFYIVLVLLVLGAMWAIFYVLFPIIWFVLKLFFSLIGIGFFIIGVILVVAMIFGLFKWRSRN